MRRTITAACAALAFAGSSACAGAPGPPPGTAADGNDARRDRVLVRVSNDRWTPVRVRLVSGGQSQRLGTVEAVREQTFELPATLAAMDVRILLTPIGDGADFVTPPLAVRRGDIVVLDVTTKLELTRYAVRTQSTLDLEARR